MSSYSSYAKKVKEKWKLLSHVRLFVNPWTGARQAPLSMISPGKNTGVDGLPFLSLRIFLTQGSKLCFLHCRQILPIWATREVHSSYTTNWGGTMWQRRFILLLRCTARLYIPPCLADMTTWLTFSQWYAKSDSLEMCLFQAWSLILLVGCDTHKVIESRQSPCQRRS